MFIAHSCSDSEYQVFIQK